MPKPAQTVEFTTDTIIIDGAPLPWPISDDYSIRYLPFSYVKGVTGHLSFAVLADSVAMNGPEVLIDGQPIPWALESAPHISRFKTGSYAVAMTVLVNTVAESTEDGAQPSAAEDMISVAESALKNIYSDVEDTWATRYPEDEE
jgi:hypothetical protein